MANSESALPRGQRYDTTFSEGKLFLGGLDSRTSKQSLIDYCSPWFVHQCASGIERCMFFTSGI
eukprot:1176092-Prorocentrum_minimum.AAC.6